MNKYVSPYSISKSSGILTEKWGVCWYKKLYDWWTMDEWWYNLLYNMHYPISEQLSPEEFKEITKYKCKEDFHKVSTELFTHNELTGGKIITYKDAMIRIMERKNEHNQTKDY